MADIVSATLSGVSSLRDIASSSSGVSGLLKVLQLRASQLKKDLLRLEDEIRRRKEQLPLRFVSPAAEEAFVDLEEVVKAANQDNILRETFAKLDEPSLWEIFKEVVLPSHLASTLEHWINIIGRSEIKADAKGSYRQPTTMSNMTIFKSGPPCQKYLRHEEYYERLDLLVSDESNKPVVVHGMPGMGKSMLTIDVALVQDKGDRFPGGVYYLDFENLSSSNYTASLIHGKFKQWGLLIGIPNDKLDESIDSIHQYFGNKRVLLVLDNVFFCNAIETRFLSMIASVKVIMTTPQLIEHIPDCEIMSIQPPESHDPCSAVGRFNRELLVSCAGEITDDAMEYAGKILRLCGGCIQAIATLGRVIGVRRKGDKTAKPWEHVLREYAYHWSTPSRNSLLNAISISFQALSSDARACLHSMNFLATGTRLPEQLIYLACYYHNVDVEYRYVEKALQELVHANLLVKYTESDSEIHAQTSFYQIHPVVGQHVHLDGNSKIWTRNLKSLVNKSYSYKLAYFYKLVKNLLQCLKFLISQEMNEEACAELKAKVMATIQEAENSKKLGFIMFSVGKLAEDLKCLETIKLKRCRDILLHFKGFEGYDKSTYLVLLMTYGKPEASRQAAESLGFEDRMVQGARLDWQWEDQLASVGELISKTLRTWAWQMVIKHPENQTTDKLVKELEMNEIHEITRALELLKND